MAARGSMPCDVVLLPGLDGTARLFERFETALGDDIPSRRVSYPPDPGLDYGALLELAAGHIGDRPAIILLGESFSGPIAIELAARWPERVRGLVLVSTFIRGPWPPPLLRGVSRIAPRRVPRVLRQMAMLGRWGDEDLRRTFGDIVDGLAAELVAARLRQISRVDASAALARVRAPILALHGRQDRLVSARPLKVALAELPGADFVAIDGPHMLLQAKPVEVARHVRAFWSRLCP